MRILGPLVLGAACLAACTTSRMVTFENVSFTSDRHPDLNHDGTVDNAEVEAAAKTHFRVGGNVFMGLLVLGPVHGADVSLQVVAPDGFVHLNSKFQPLRDGRNLVGTGGPVSALLDSGGAGEWEAVWIFEGEPLRGQLFFVEDEGGSGR